MGGTLFGLWPGAASALSCLRRRLPLMPAYLARAREIAEAARALLDKGPRVALLTRGPEGAVVITRREATPVHVPAEKVVDTIGAGDAFSGGFLAWWSLRNLGKHDLDDPRKVLDAARFAAQVAARTVERAGASPPYLSELEAPAS
jgi:fructokinase